jgi:hypothetical protein
MYLLNNKTLKILTHHYRNSALCRVPNGLPSFFGHSVKELFVECQTKNAQEKNTQQRSALPSGFSTLSKKFLAKG